MKVPRSCGVRELAPAQIGQLAAAQSDFDGELSLTKREKGVCCIDSLGHGNKVSGSANPKSTTTGDRFIVKTRPKPRHLQAKNTKPLPSVGEVCELAGNLSKTKSRESGREGGEGHLPRSTIVKTPCIRLATAIFLGTLATIATAQQPDVQVKADLYGSFFSGKGENNAIRFYDLMGHYGTVALSVNFEQGFHIWASERLERIANNRDSEQLDEYYVEDPGIWRLGKQYLPFGRQGLLREDARAARGDTRLLFKDVPISLAVCDNGTRLAQGVVGRLGSVIGLSFAYGHNFGAESTDFTVVRRPEELIPGRGYGAIVGVDFARHFGMYTLQIEGAALRNGDTPLDQSTDIADALVTLQPNKYQAVTLGISRDWNKDLTLFRVQGKFLLTRSVWLEPIVRTRNSEFYDLGVTLHVKL